MWILLVCVIAVVVGQFFVREFNDGDAIWMVGAVMTVAGLAVGVCLLLSLPIVRVETRSNIVAYHATAETILRARLAGVESENVALQLKVVEANQWLRRAQYWNRTQWRWWWPDEVDTLQSLR